MTKWWIGCSGFHYKHWKGVFYPEKLPQKKWFDFYKQHFNTLELNVTFYRFPQVSFLQNWYDNSPEAFSFSVKAPKAITHYKQFIASKEMLADFYGTIQEGLKEKLGCVLFQLPPRIGYKPEKLKLIIDNLDPAYRNVLEFRNETWWNAEVFQLLTENNISFCGMSHPLLPEDVVVNNKTLYYRFHGVPDCYKSPYEFSVLQQVSDDIANDDRVKEAFIYFNNDIDASAIKNATEMSAYTASLK
jgi:uncharacterized protein YecE (DUF72 family)